MNEKLEKLLDRCNEMDITEQLNWLGDASMPYQAKMEYVAMRVDITALRARLETMRVALEAIEWYGEKDGMTGLCPYCHSIEKHGHGLYCKIGAALESETK